MLCGIADVYDAMRSQRKYQQAFPSERILAVLQRNDGKQFDQNLVRRFVQLLGIYPVGNLVKLNTGEIAIVLQVHAPDPYRPKVRVLFAADGARLELPHDINLWETAKDGRDDVAVVRHRSAQSCRLRNRSAVVHLIADILVGLKRGREGFRTHRRKSSRPLCSQGVPMSGFHRVVPCAAIAALVFAGSSRLTGQAPVENGRSIALAAAEDTLPAALDRVDAMLTAGELDIARPARRHDDSRPRASSASASSTKVCRCSADRSCARWMAAPIVSVTGRLYEALDIDVNPSITPERASAVALAAAGAGANIRGETTLGILPVENGYRLVYRMDVLSDWAIRDVYVDADSGEIAPVDQRAFIRKPRSDRAAAFSARSGR